MHHRPLGPYALVLFSSVFWIFLFTLLVTLETAALPQIGSRILPLNSIFFIASVAVLFFEPRWGFVVAFVGAALIDAITLTPGRFLVGVPVAIVAIHILAQRYFTNRSLWSVVSLAALGTIVVQFGARLVSGTMDVFLEHTIVQMITHSILLCIVFLIVRTVQLGAIRRGRIPTRAYETALYF